MENILLELMESNKNSAHVKLEDGREATVNVKNLVPLLDGDIDTQEDVELIELEDTPEDSTNKQIDDSDSDIEDMVGSPGEIDKPIEEVIPSTLNSPVEGRSKTNDNRGMTPI